MSEITDDILLGDPNPWYSDREKLAYERLALEALSNDTKVTNESEAKSE